MNQRKKTTLDSRLENSRAIKSNKKNYLENGFVYHRFLKSMSQYQSQYTDSVASFWFCIPKKWVNLKMIINIIRVNILCILNYFDVWNFRLLVERDFHMWFMPVSGVGLTSIRMSWSKSNTANLGLTSKLIQYASTHIIMRGRRAPALTCRGWPCTRPQCQVFLRMKIAVGVWTLSAIIGARTVKGLLQVPPFFQVTLLKNCIEFPCTHIVYIAKDESFISVKHLLIASFIFSGSSSNLHPNAVAPPGSQQANQMFGANHQGAATDPQSIIQQRPSNGAAQQQQQVRKLFLSFILVGYTINKLRIRLKYI